MRHLAPIALLIAGCVTQAVPPARDTGTIAGSWREVRPDNQPISNGYALSISTFSTFAVQKGCVATGGVLAPLGGGRYRIDRYETGFATDACGPWRSGPEVAPFDSAEVSIVRHGNRLGASGGGRHVELRWIAGPTV